MNKTFGILLLFIVGVSLAVYPWVDRYIQDSKQQQLLETWSELQTVLTEDNQEKDRSEPDAGLIEEGPQDEPTDDPRMIGTVTIPAIAVKEPILPDATAPSLKVGAGQVVADRRPGEQGNFAIAAHRSRTFGKQFNRLGELEVGDEVVIETREGRYVYEVSESFLVLPDELSVLEQSTDASELTMITCHPVKNPTHRLIVKALMKSEI